MKTMSERVYVAGDQGMVGSAIVRRLKPRGCKLITANRSELDLRSQSEVKNWFHDMRPEVVYLAAARVGGILANDTHPVEFLQDNLQIELNVIQSAFESGVKKLIFLGSSCIYPKYADQPIAEDALLNGPLEPTNEWYAIAKIAGIKLCQAYRKQHGADFIAAMPCNLYGEFDNFDLDSSHVIPALLRKTHEAKYSGSKLQIWGSGLPRREFLYADDAADAIVFLADHYSGYEHVNVGSGQDVTIKDLVGLICEVVGFEGPIEYDSSKPDGTPRKLMDNSRLTKLGWQSSTGLKAGLAKAYRWFLDNPPKN